VHRQTKLAQENPVAQPCVVQSLAQLPQCLLSLSAKFCSQPLPDCVSQSAKVPLHVSI